MDLSSRLDEILQVRPDSQLCLWYRSKVVSLPGEEVSEVNEFTMSLIFDIDHSPSVLSTSD